MNDTKRILSYIGVGLLVLSVLFIYVIPFYDDGVTKYRMYSFGEGGVFTALPYLIFIIGAVAFVLLNKLQYATWFTIAASSMICWDAIYTLYAASDDEYYKKGVIALVILIEISAAVVMILIQTDLIGESNRVPNNINTSVNDIEIKENTSDNLHVTAHSLEKNTSQQTTVISDEKVAELKKYKSLLDANAITQEQFDSLKKQILGL